jgi:PAS domain S-box-containing protein
MIPHLHILLVEDDEDDYIITREMLSRSLQTYFHVDWAESFTEGKRLLETGQYDAVLMDYDLGDGTGIELIREFAHRGYPGTFLLLTGRGTPEVDVEAMEAGASVYLNKSEINTMLLERSIRYGMERKQIENELVARNEELDRKLAQLRELEAALRENEVTLRLAHEAAGLGIWRYSLLTRQLYLDDRAQEHHALDKENPSNEEVIRQLHPDDVVRVRREASDFVAGRTDSFRTSYRVVSDSQGYCWITVQALMHTDPAGGSPLMIIGTSQDITERTNTEQALAYQSLLLSKFPDPVIGADADNCITYWNAASEDAFGWTADEAVGKDGLELLQVQIEGQKDKEVLRLIIQDGYFEGPVRYVTKEGRSMVCFTRVAVLRSDSGRVVGTVSALRSLG